jgi:hypothetical protein
MTHEYLKIFILLLLLIFSISSFQAFAFISDEGEDDLMLFPIVGEGAITLPRNHFMISSHVELMNFKNLLDPTPHFFRSGDEFESKYRKASSITDLRYGINDNVTMGIKLRYNDVENTDVLNPLGGNNSTAAMGDTDLFFKFKFPDFNSPSDIALTLGVEFPTGDVDETPVTGTGGVDFNFGGHITTQLHRGRIFADLNYKFIRDYSVNANLNPNARMEYADFLHVVMPQFTNITTQTVDPGSEITWDVGYVYPFTEQFSLSGELYGFKGQLASINDVTVQHSDFNWVFLCPGLRYSPDPDLVFEGTVMIPVSEKIPFDKAAFSVDPSSDYWYKMGFNWHFK